jgi:hypothetical protein
LLPLMIDAGAPGKEVLHPVAITIFGGTDKRNASRRPSHADPLLAVRRETARASHRERTGTPAGRVDPAHPRLLTEEMNMKRLSVLAASLLIAGAAYAHGPDKGPHGGPQVDAGDYHVELVAQDTALAVYLNNDKNEPVDAKGHKATGIFVVSGKPQRIELQHRKRQQACGHGTGGRCQPR